MIKNDGYDCAVKGAKESLKKMSDYICENDYDKFLI